MQTSVITGSMQSDELLREIHAIGKKVLAEHAEEVDRDARFPRESIDALRIAKLLSANVPKRLGGMGLNIVEVGRICETLAQYCGSSAMIFAMHMIQVACIVDHAQKSIFFRDYLNELVEQQRLIASATTEVGVGGDLRRSLCAIEVDGPSFRLIKKAPVISYGEEADDILITCRRAPDSAESEQLQVLLLRGQFVAERTSGWDALGFRGTCSCGFVVSANGRTEQILPAPFADILAGTMHPYSHIVWCSLWTGIGIDAVNLARAFVRAEARKAPGETPLSAIRLAELDRTLQEMRHNVQNLTREYQQMLETGHSEAFNDFGFSIRTNNLKLSCSRLVVDIVSHALLICGMAGYSNDSKYSLSRHLRDAHGAALMVNNDRIMKLNAQMLLFHKEY